MADTAEKINKFIKISQFRTEYFSEGSAPTAYSIKKMISMGEITGKILGGMYYVVIDEKITQFDQHEI